MKYFGVGVHEIISSSPNQYNRTPKVVLQSKQKKMPLQSRHKPLQRTLAILWRVQSRYEVLGEVPPSVSIFAQKQIEKMT